MTLVTEADMQGDGSVAIVMRTKDRPVMLSRALDSILSQTYPNWHLYVVNDGGESAAVNDLLASHAEHIAGRITVIHHEKNVGMEGAANAGILAAVEQFVTIHDDDDTWDPLFLEETVSALTSKEGPRFSGMISHCSVVNERIDGMSVIEESRGDWFSYPHIVEFREMLKRNLFPPICLVFRRSVVPQIGGYNESLKMLCDWDFHLRLLMVGDIGVVPRRLANYHIRSNNHLSAYGNSVRGGAHVHDFYRTLYQNSFLRGTFGRDPSATGVISMLMGAIAEGESNLTALSSHFNHMTHAQFDDVKTRVDKVERLIMETKSDIAKLASHIERYAESHDGTNRSQSSGVLRKLIFALRRKST